MRNPLCVLLLLVLASAGAHADGRDEPDSLVLASESYFGVSQEEIVVIERRGIAREELPVVLFLASRARVRPAAVLELRLAGRSWFDIARHYRLSAEVFYVPATRVSGPYEVTYRVYSRPRAEWDTIVLRDEDVLNLVNLKFYAEHYGCEPDEVIALRAGGEDFVTIHRTIRRRFVIDARIDLDVAASVDAELEAEYEAEAESYFEVPPQQVTVVRQRGIPDAEMPVVLFLAAHARVEPALIVDLRLRGLTWMEITRRYRLGAEIYYVPVEGVSVELINRAPYGRAYGYYRRHPRSEWHRIVLADADVINLVNLRVACEHYGYRPERVIELRAEGRPFSAIYSQVIVEKKGHGKSKTKVYVKEGKGKSHGKSKGDKGKSKGKGKKHDDD
jgi:hypothetical protein